MENMIEPRRIKSVVFDFAGTLCSEPYFTPLGQDSLKAIGQLVFGDNSLQWADPWMKGDISSQDIAQYLSRSLPEIQDRILSALREGCSALNFNSAVYNFAVAQRQAGRKTALVTANMDVFTEVVVPARGLDRVFDVVLNTADHHTLDKSILWRRAFSILGSGRSFSSALLIDDSPRMIAMFRSLGGFAYQYEGDEAFHDWIVETGFKTSGEVRDGRRNISCVQRTA